MERYHIYKLGIAIIFYAIYCRRPMVNGLEVDGAVNNPNNKTSSGEDYYVYYQGVQGKPGVDFPVHSRIPRTSFSCKEVESGYYADLETDCQVFHICNDGTKVSFLCPNGTIFQQSDLICDWWFKVNCTNSPNLYVESAEQLRESNIRRKASRRVFKNDGKIPDMKEFLVAEYNTYSGYNNNNNKAANTNPSSKSKNSNGRATSHSNFNINSRESNNNKPVQSGNKASHNNNYSNSASATHNNNYENAQNAHSSTGGRGSNAASANVQNAHVVNSNRGSARSYSNTAGNNRKAKVVENSNNRSSNANPANYRNVNGATNPSSFGTKATSANNYYENKPTSTSFVNNNANVQNNNANRNEPSSSNYQSNNYNKPSSNVNSNDKAATVSNNYGNNNYKSGSAGTTGNGDNYKEQGNKPTSNYNANEYNKATSPSGNSYSNHGVKATASSNTYSASGNDGTNYNNRQGKSFAATENKSTTSSNFDAQSSYGNSVTYGYYNKGSSSNKQGNTNAPAGFSNTGGFTNANSYTSGNSNADKSGSNSLNNLSDSGKVSITGSQESSTQSNLPGNVNKYGRYDKQFSERKMDVSEEMQLVAETAGFYGSGLNKISTAGKEKTTNPYPNHRTTYSELKHYTNLPAVSTPATPRSTINNGKPFVVSTPKLGVYTTEKTTFKYSPTVPTVTPSYTKTSYGNRIETFTNPPSVANGKSTTPRKQKAKNSFTIGLNSLQGSVAVKTQSASTTTTAKPRRDKGVIKLSLSSDGGAKPVNNGRTNFASVTVGRSNVFKSGSYSNVQHSQGAGFSSSSSQTPSPSISTQQPVNGDNNYSNHQHSTNADYQSTNYNNKQQYSFNYDSEKSTNYNSQQAGNYNHQESGNNNNHQSTNNNNQQSTNYNQQSDNNNNQHSTNNNNQQSANNKNQESTNNNDQQSTNYNQEAGNNNNQQSSNYNNPQSANNNNQQSTSYNNQQSTSYNNQQSTSYNNQQSANNQQFGNFNNQQTPEVGVSVITPEVKSTASYDPNYERYDHLGVEKSSAYAGAVSDAVLSLSAGLQPPDNVEKIETTTAGYDYAETVTAGHGTESTVKQGNRQPGTLDTSVQPPLPTNADYTSNYREGRYSSTTTPSPRRGKSGFYVTNTFRPEEFITSEFQLGSITGSKNTYIPTTYTSTTTEYVSNTFGFLKPTGKPKPKPFEPAPTTEKPYLTTADYDDLYDLEYQISSASPFTNVPPTLPSSYHTSAYEVTTKKVVKEHVDNMLDTLKEIGSANPRPGLIVPPSVGPQTLHTLAVYFANALDNLVPEDGKTEQPVSEDSVINSLLSKNTVDGYNDLFMKGKKEEEEDDEGEVEDDNDLNTEHSSNPVQSPRVRQLAKVFTQALSSYLDDPDMFRKVLQQIRPTEPPPLATENPEEDELLNFSDADIKPELPRLPTPPPANPTWGYILAFNNSNNNHLEENLQTADTQSFVPGYNDVRTHWTQSPEVTKLWRNTLSIDPLALNENLENSESPTVKYELHALPKIQLNSTQVHGLLINFMNSTEDSVRLKRILDKLNTTQDEFLEKMKQIEENPLTRRLILLLVSECASNSTSDTVHDILSLAGPNSSKESLQSSSTNWEAVAQRSNLTLDNKPAAFSKLIDSELKEEDQDARALQLLNSLYSIASKYGK